MTSETPLVNLRLGVGYALAILSGILIPFSAVVTHAAGYVAATLFAFTLAGTARRASMMAATESGKPQDPRFVTAAHVLLLIGFVIGAAHAWFIALELSK